MTAVPLKVDFLANPHDLRVVVLGSLGWSTEAIRKATGLTSCQVQYRLAKSGTRRMDYRDGSSQTARLVLGQTEKVVAASARDKLLGKRNPKLKLKRA